MLLNSLCDRISIRISRQFFCCCTNLYFVTEYFTVVTTSVWHYAMSEKIAVKTTCKKTNILRIDFNNILPFTARFRKWPLVATCCIRKYYFFPILLAAAYPFKIFDTVTQTLLVFTGYKRADSIPRYYIRQTNKYTLTSVIPTRALH